MKRLSFLLISSTLLLLVGVLSFAKPKTSWAFPSVFGARIIGDEGIFVDGRKVEDEDEPLTADSPTPTFEGYTVPQARVLLIIRTDPIEAETLSDAHGYWKYTLGQPLEPGQHTLSLRVTDKNGVTSDQVLAATFIVPEVKGAGSATPAATTSPLPKSPRLNYLTITLIVLGSLILLGVAYAFLSRRSRD